ncbi:histidinol phosphate phosphatase H [Eremomyces bilateralis CBS 781.70]|uniref:Histidinol-phosphatase n=1 Tax=Eremomyces bilateralis CBS 781.70 TaxID=1392243 RepID=A0A6G1GBI7_9PEZI|nr:histidinol phosphate phosphatase H [Eremomyces bilateralis CBS 781.70]KAF1815374.1 histidinol phosphate phosphatase H [Eremomyces bilateralis CBS 781.70]
MPFSHHSHSGQFCAHAKNTLEEVIQQAVNKGFRTFALTEHIPRPNEHLYAEEVAENYSWDILHQLFRAYLKEALRLREKYADKISILIGFESEFVTPNYVGLVEDILNYGICSDDDVSQRSDFNFYMGSIHHVKTIPIDFSKELYVEARDACGGTDVDLFCIFFDEQYELLQRLKPPVVGHFDLIRLYSNNPNGSIRALGSAVWSKVIRNLQFAADNGLILEVNSSALRKGMDEPYPCVEIMQEYLRMKGRFTLSDDSHGIDQVGLNYPKAVRAMKAAGVGEIQVVTTDSTVSDMKTDCVPLSEVEALLETSL